MSGMDNWVFLFSDPKILYRFYENTMGEGENKVKQIVKIFHSYK